MEQNPYYLMISNSNVAKPLIEKFNKYDTQWVIDPDLIYVSDKYLTFFLFLYNQYIIFN